jgi:hypothetical protein
MAAPAPSLTGTVHAFRPRREANMKTTWRVERLKDLAALSVGLSVLLLIARLW